MIEAVIAGVILLVIVGVAWYSVKQNASSQARVESAEAATDAANSRNKELEALRRDNDERARKADDDKAAKISTPADAAAWLQDSFARPSDDPDTN